MREDLEKEYKLKLTDTNDYLNNMLDTLQLNIESLGDYILDNYTQAEFILPLIEFNIPKNDTEKMIKLLSLNDSTLNNTELYLSNVIKPRFRTLGKMLTKDLHIEFQILNDVEIKFGWNTSGKLALFAVKE